MIRTTTALRKISSLKKRIWNVLGGQGSGKTYSILIILINHALTNANKEIFIASEELSKMRITVIKDFINIMKDFNLHYKITLLGGTLAKFPNGSFIKFIGLDKENIGKGLRSDVIFVNEANKIKFETYRELTSRAKRIIIDYNPNKKYWANTEIATREDCDSLVLTYLDNEYLSQEEINEILGYKEKGYDSQGNIINEYWANKWRIYGLGEIGGVEGRIFHWKEIGYNDYLKIDRPYLIGVDWGTSDPFAILEAKYYDGSLYVHELNYKSENEWRQRLSVTDLQQISGSNDDGFVTWLFSRLHIAKNVDVICDNNRQSKIISLRNAGWDRAVAVKKPPGSIMDGIDLLQNLNVYYTSTSENIDNEQMEYCWKKDRFDIQLEEPEDANNHQIDAIRYVAMYLRNIGVIRKV
jgi:phage terminase large subunit